MPRTGRRPGDTTTREDILTSARARFGEDGYTGATIRAIAGDAGVDPALVHHYFGTKKDLFAACMELPVRLDVIVETLAGGDPDAVGQRIVRTFLGVWDEPAGRDRMRGLLRAAVTDDDAARMLREFLLDAVLRPLADQLARDRAMLRATLVGSQLIGLAFARYIIAVDPLASTDRDTLVAAYAPTLQRYLTGDLDG